MRKAPKTKLQKWMLALCIAELLAGLLAGIFAIGGIYAGSPAMESSLVGISVGEETITTADARHFSTLATNFGIYSLIVSVSLLVMSVFSWRTFRREDKAKITSRVSIFCIALCLAGLLWGIFGKVVGWSDLLFYLVLLALEVGSLYLSLRIYDEASPEVRARMEARKNMTREERLADNEHLGFLRFIEFIYVINIVSTVVSLVFMSRNSIVYDFGTVLSFINVVLDGVCLFLVIRRYRFTKQWAIAGALFNIVVVTAYNLLSGRFAGEGFAASIALHLITVGWDIVVLLYFLRSKRVELLMVRELDLTVDENAVELNRHGWPYFRNLLLYYCVFSTLGHWMEAGFCKLIDLGVFAGDPGYDNTMLWRDWLYPFPMHGIAVVLIVVILYPLKEKVRSRLDAIPTIIVMFVVNMVICTGIEFAGGLMFNANLQNWDYSALPFNFMGQICLQNALGFGFAATVVEYVVYPAIERLVARVPNELMNTICVGVFAFYAILTALYVIDFSPEAAAANAASYFMKVM